MYWAEIASNAEASPGAAKRKFMAVSRFPNGIILEKIADNGNQLTVFYFTVILAAE